MAKITVNRKVFKGFSSESKNETKFDPSQYDYFKASYTLDGTNRVKNTNGVVDAQGTLEMAQRHGATNLNLVGVKDGTETDIPLSDVGISESKNEAMSLKGFLEALEEKLVKQFDLDEEEVKNYLDTHTQEMQELLDDKDLSLKEKVLFVRGEITGEKDEAKEPTEEKLGYEKGHKNSKGEDAPWVIRSHEDNRILASFAHKKDAEEHMKRMKQYSKTEKMGENREDWAPCILVARNPIANNTDYCYNLDGDWTPHEDNAYIFKTVQSAEQTVQKFVDKLQRGHVNGFAAWTTKNISIEPLKDNGSKSEELETYACFIDFETEDDAKQGLEIVKGWHPVRDDTAVVVDGLGEGAANHLWNDWKQKCAKAGLAISDEGEVYKEEPSCIYGESKKSEALFNKTEMEKIALSEASSLDNYRKDVISELAVSFHYGEDGATKLADKYSDTINDAYVEGESLPYETARLIARQDGNGYANESKKSESKKSEVRLELIDTIVVPKWLWEAYNFGNEYGEDLDEHEQNILSEFKEKYADCHLDDEDEESYFSSYNDFDSYGGQCYTVKVYKEQ